MGCLPGAEVELIQLAPLNDPLYICVNGSHLAIRKETASKIETLSPFDAQTGPAKRNDTKTLKKHEAILTKNQKEVSVTLVPEKIK